jgi:hypothetical protein
MGRLRGLPHEGRSPRRRRADGETIDEAHMLSRQAGRSPRGRANQDSGAVGLPCRVDPRADGETLPGSVAPTIKVGADIKSP